MMVSDELDDMLLRRHTIRGKKEKQQEAFSKEKAATPNGRVRRSSRLKN